MSESQLIEILLVEDDPNDVELTLHAFRKHHLLNHVFVVHDGAEALDFLFAKAPIVHSPGPTIPRLCCSI